MLTAGRLVKRQHSRCPSSGQSSPAEQVARRSGCMQRVAQVNPCMRTPQCGALDHRTHHVTAWLSALGGAVEREWIGMMLQRESTID